METWDTIRKEINNNWDLTQDSRSRT
ncbi:MAG: hypothetical protein ACD_40C00258G0003, partial [uncultured bacterium]